MDSPRLPRSSSRMNLSRLGKTAGASNAAHEPPRLPVAVHATRGTRRKRGRTAGYPVLLRRTESLRTGVAAAATAEGRRSRPVAAGSDDWFRGRIRNVRSIRSDYWRGTAVALARRSAIGVYPIGGWWKENPNHKRYDRRVRYALVVSIRVLNGEIDIYTPVRTQIAVATVIRT